MLGIWFGALFNVTLDLEGKCLKMFSDIARLLSAIFLFHQIQVHSLVYLKKNKKTTQLDR